MIGTQMGNAQWIRKWLQCLGCLVGYHNRNSNRENINFSDEIIKFISIAVTVKAKHKTLKNEMCKWLMQWLIMK
jgi:hypothetical protein